MKKTLLQMSVVTLSLATLVGCIGLEDPELELAAAQESIPSEVQEDITDTKTLNVDGDFSFDTSRSIDIDFDLESARGEQASVSICTSYEQAEGDYDVDYESCAVRGPLVDGVFSHSMEITNEFDSVVAVVWFQDSAMAPLHREFSIDAPVAVAGTRGLRAASDQRRVIVWK